MFKLARLEIVPMTPNKSLAATTCGVDLWQYTDEDQDPPVHEGLRRGRRFVWRPTSVMQSESDGWLNRTRRGFGLDKLE